MHGNRTYSARALCVRLYYAWTDVPTLRTWRRCSCRMVARLQGGDGRKAPEARHRMVGCMPHPILIDRFLADVLSGIA